MLAVWANTQGIYVVAMTVFELLFIATFNSGIEHLGARHHDLITLNWASTSLPVRFVVNLPELDDLIVGGNKPHAAGACVVKECEGVYALINFNAF